MVGRICPPWPGEDRVKVSENLGTNTVAPVAPCGYIPGFTLFPKSHLKVVILLKFLESFLKSSILFADAKVACFAM